MKKNKPNQTTQTQTTETGEITRFVFAGNDGFRIFSILTNAGKAIGVKGCCPETVAVGDTVTVTGKPAQYNGQPQIKAESIIPERPDENTSEGVQKLLQKLPTIGPLRAKTAIQEFGHVKAWKYALDDPLKLKVPLLRVEEVKKKAAELLIGYDEQVFLLGIGMTGHQINKVINEFGQQAMDTVKTKPYALLRIHGFGFKIADLIALKAGCSPGAPARLQHCIEYFLNESECNGGNTWIYLGTLIHGAEIKGREYPGVLSTLTDGVMSAGVPFVAVTEEMVKAAIFALVDIGRVEIDKAGHVFSAELRAAEKNILKAAQDSVVKIEQGYDND